MTTVTYSIPNISCTHCVHTVKTEIGEIQGVSLVEADAVSKQATVTFNPPATEEEIKSVLNEINYPPEN